LTKNTTSHRTASRQQPPPPQQRCFTKKPRKLLDLAALFVGGPQQQQQQQQQQSPPEKVVTDDPSEDPSFHSDDGDTEWASLDISVVIPPAVRIEDDDNIKQQEDDGKEDEMIDWQNRLSRTAPLPMQDTKPPLIALATSFVHEPPAPMVPRY
jgi:hypothetical protein